MLVVAESRSQYRVRVIGLRGHPSAFEVSGTTSHIHSFNTSCMAFMVLHRAYNHVSLMHLLHLDLYFTIVRIQN